MPRLRDRIVFALRPDLADPARAVAGLHTQLLQALATTATRGMDAEEARSERDAYARRLQSSAASLDGKHYTYVKPGTPEYEDAWRDIAMPGGVDGSPPDSGSGSAGSTPAPAAVVRERTLTQVGAEAIVGYNAGRHDIPAALPPQVHVTVEFRSGGVQYLIVTDPDYTCTLPPGAYRATLSVRPPCAPDAYRPDPEMERWRDDGEAQRLIDAINPLPVAHTFLGYQQRVVHDDGTWHMCQRSVVDAIRRDEHVEYRPVFAGAWSAARPPEHRPPEATVRLLSV